jgi:hypothetical protein
VNTCAAYRQAFQTRYAVQDHGSESWRPTNGGIPLAAVLSLAQAERAAVDLRQGTSAEEMEKLLAKPLQTSLKDDRGFQSTPTQLANAQLAQRRCKFVRAAFRAR